MIKPKKIIRSLISFLPILNNFLKQKGTSPLNGEYYYNIFNHHIRTLIEHGFTLENKTLAEFGPGDTFGVGLCAILHGFKEYLAFDVIKHADVENNIGVLNDLMKFYPSKSAEIDTLKKELTIQFGNKIKYVVPWNSELNLKHSSIDLILTNATMEHLLDLEETYTYMYKWLKPGGYCSHEIDFGAHEFSNSWYEHFYLNKHYWDFLMHGRMYPINRMPYSFHYNILTKIGFQIVYEKKNRAEKLDKNRICNELKQFFIEDDLSIRSAHLIVKK